MSREEKGQATQSSILKILNPKELGPDCVVARCSGTQELLLFLFKSLAEVQDASTGVLQSVRRG